MPSHSNHGQNPSAALTRYQRRILLLGCGLLVGLMVIVRYFSPIPLSDLTRDPLALIDQPFYLGLLSNVGILLWCFSATVCFFGSLLLLIAQGKRESVLFFGAFGALSLLLMLDDLLMIHEVLDYVLYLMPEEGTFAIYGLLTLASLWRFRKMLLRTQPWLFGLSLAFFAISVGLDSIVPKDWIVGETEYLLEDGCKLLAIFVWSVYFCRAALENLLDLIRLPVKSKP